MMSRAGRAGHFARNNMKLLIIHRSETFTPRGIPVHSLTYTENVLVHEPEPSNITHNALQKNIPEIIDIFAGREDT